MTTTPNHPAQRLTSQASSKLPRWVLITLCLIYIVPGLLNRDPWGSDDVIGIAQMMTLADLPMRHWLAPQAFGIAVEQEGPLTFWLGAALIKLLSPIFSAAYAARLSNLIWFSILTSSVWYATYYLGKRHEAQPLALPFGGEPNPTQWARMLGDASLLLLLATLGLLWRSHVSSAELATIAMQGVCIFACVYFLYRPKVAAFALGFGLGGLFLARGIPTLLPTLTAILLLASFKFIPRRYVLLCSLPIALLIGLAWLIPTSLMFPKWIAYWWKWNLGVMGLPSLASLEIIIKNLPWFLWPSFPLAIFALARWQGYWSLPHIGLPFVFLITHLLILLLIARPADAEGLSILIPSAILASLGLPTMRRGLINALDWFAVMSFTFILALFWFGWLAVMTGIPRQVANNFAKQTMGYEFSFSWLTLVIALFITSTWIGIVVWRIKVRPTALWRGSVLSASGLICVWLVSLIFFLPAANYSKSYRNVATELAHVLKTQVPNNCVQPASMSLSQRAALGVFANIQFAHAPRCEHPFVLLFSTKDQLSKALAKYPNWQVVWESRRAANRQERILLLKPPSNP